MPYVTHSGDDLPGKMTETRLDERLTVYRWALERPKGFARTQDNYLWAKPLSRVRPEGFYINLVEYPKVQTLRVWRKNKIAY